MSKPPKPAIAYLRVSAQGQQKNDRGLELQQTRIYEFARHFGYEIVQEFSDAHSCKDDGISRQDRPGAFEASLLARGSGYPIIVDDLSRFARNTNVLGQLIADGRLTVIDAKMGVRVSRVVEAGEAARSPHERKLISVSTKSALQKLKEQGVRLGNPTNLEEAQAKGAAKNKERAQSLARELAPVIQELRRGGRETAQEIADGLNEQGYQASRGSPWKTTNIRRLISRVDELRGVRKLGDEVERFKDNLPADAIN